MRRVIRISLLIFLSLFILSGQAEGVFEVVYDPTVDADILQTFTFFENEIVDLEKQIDDLDKALKLLSSGKYLWSNTVDLINELGKTMEQASGLSYAAQNEAAEFAALFPGYSSLSNFNQQYQQITKGSLDTLNNILQTMKQSANNFTNESSRLQKLQGFTENVVGQTQAMQMVVQFASEQISQLQLVRQTVMAQANAQIVYYAQQIQKEASAVADLNETIANGDIVTTGVLNAHPLAKPEYQ
jgi:P-type conjugative transfer protein TrbJ